MDPTPWASWSAFLKTERLIPTGVQTWRRLEPPPLPTPGDKGRDGEEGGGEAESKFPPSHLLTDAQLLLKGCVPLLSRPGSYLFSPSWPHASAEKKCYSQDSLICSPLRASEGGTFQNQITPVLGELGVSH